ncbi:lipocalin family protein [Rhodobacteraceae bacterium 2376]|uniref:Outer membrane lipoprotein Blc n=1 Tax=Rhabdonatronobacter sediminivivens TaxID=2743469 RepID=A0A7Z0HYL9_9RHOB|nr:lipocalin family protein [Rhabdonatronobacter sediminivivens]NYS24686.1 lipocalin family protein [Rhabdonatronobacter sediminivivens]
MRLLAALALALLAGCGTVWRDTDAPMTPVAALDLDAYAGRWYEVARFPVPFQRGCTATTADYGPPEDGAITVVNTCRRGAPDGPVSQIAGRATVVGPGQLRVRLGRIPFAGAYWVLWVAPDHDTAVVGVPSGRAGWILHRSPDIPPQRLEQAGAVLAAAGYDLSHLKMTEH